MKRMSERQHLLERCLRLEARVLSLQADLRAARPIRRNVRPEDRQEIQRLHHQGKTPRATATQTGWSKQTVYNALHAMEVRP